MEAIILWFKQLFCKHRWLNNYRSNTRICRECCKETPIPDDRGMWP